PQTRPDQLLDEFILGRFVTRICRCASSGRPGKNLKAAYSWGRACAGRRNCNSRKQSALRRNALLYSRMRGIFWGGGGQNKVAGTVARAAQSCVARRGAPGCRYCFRRLLQLAHYRKSADLCDVAEPEIL